MSERLTPVAAFGVSLQTIVMVLGFAATLIGIGASWSNLTNEQNKFAEFVSLQRQLNARFDERMMGVEGGMGTLANVNYRVAQLEQGVSSHGDDMRQIQGQVSTLTTQLAVLRSAFINDYYGRGNMPVDSLSDDNETDVRRAR